MCSNSSQIHSDYDFDSLYQINANKSMKSRLLPVNEPGLACGVLVRGSHGGGGWQRLSNKTHNLQ